MVIYQIFVKHLNGRTQCLRLPSPSISGASLRRALYASTNIPLASLRLVSGPRLISDDTLLSASPSDSLFPSCSVLLPLRGGKGGFGSLLRGAATKAGQKKTNNFDACRDMSGRRLRHVNAEKRLEEWKAEAEERRLEKIAEDFLKKKAKVGKNRSSADADKYVEKYREDSAKCMEEVEASVRESFELYENSKRKLLPESGVSTSKRLKTWLGKGKEVESDSDGDDDNDDGEDNDKSVVLDDGGYSAQSQGDEGSSGSFSAGQLEGESSGGFSTGSNFGEEKGKSHDGCSKFGEDSGIGALTAATVFSFETGHGVLELGASSGSEAVDWCAEGSECEAVDDKLEGSGSEAATANIDGSGCCTLNTETMPTIESTSGVCGVALPSANISNQEGPLNFYYFNSATEMEVLGMERLKTELQACGLKCGGTLQERAARLFLLKTMPIEMLPKKMLAKPVTKVGDKLRT